MKAKGKLTSTPKKEKLTIKQWIDKAHELFGQNLSKTRFVCPSCGNIQSIADFLPYMDKEEAASYVHFSCIGRFDGIHGNVHMGTKPGPCNYTSGGLFQINTSFVITDTGDEIPVFAFDESQKKERQGETACPA